MLWQELDQCIGPRVTTRVGHRTALDTVQFSTFRVTKSIAESTDKNLLREVPTRICPVPLVEQRDSGVDYGTARQRKHPQEKAIFRLGKI